MIIEIQAKGMLTHVKGSDPWFGLKYNMNIYRGCQHQCIYCDSRSECYQIANFADIQVKVNSVELLQKELKSKRVKGTIGTGSMSDPYGPLEREYNLTSQAMKVIAFNHFPVHIITKSNLVLRDIDILQEIKKTYAAVSLTLTTVDDALAKKTEPGAPPPSVRLDTIEKLASAGIYTGVTMMPILPFIGDRPKDIVEIIKRASASGAKYIIPWLGMSLRDRQRIYYYEKLDQLFPGVRAKYERAYGNQYQCEARHIKELWQIFNDACKQYGVTTVMDKYEPQDAKVQQISLFGGND